MFNDDIESSNEFQDMNIDFDETVEIAKILPTKRDKVLQIVAKDNK